MAPFVPVFGRVLTASFALPLQQQNHHHATTTRRCAHSTVTSPFAASSVLSATIPPINDDNNNEGGPVQEKSTTSTTMSLSDLCRQLGAFPTDLLYLSTEESDGERGVYVNRDVKENDILLHLPLTSCLRDDQPAAWFSSSIINGDSSPNDDEIAHAADQWSTRLASSLLQTKLLQEKDNGWSTWMSLLPNPNYLRASLPVHWSEQILSSAKCMALELAVDTAYFARAQAVADLVASLQRHHLQQQQHNYYKNENILQSLCNDALDLVQTRSCRVERERNGQRRPLRILAPIFDFINHGSCHLCTVEGCANAVFRLEDDDSALVVRATQDIRANEEVLLDYGDSARPEWKCLVSYGFVPEYYENLEAPEGESIAEVYMDGIRYEVGPSTVPYEMVEAAATALMAEEMGDGGSFGDEIIGVARQQQQQDRSSRAYSNDDELAGQEDDLASLLTPPVALRIAKRLSDVAFYLLLEPDLSNAGDDDEELDDTPEEVIAAKLAASLRWSQHKVLLACALGLRDYAAATQKNQKQ